MDLSYTALDSAAQTLGCGLLKDEPMSRHTTFRIGGPADRFLTAQTTVQLSGLLKVLEAERIPWLLLGNGSDLLVSDKGVRGAVIALGEEFRKIELLPDGATLRAGAGASLMAVCAFARDHGLSGLEFAWGIPGSVGGAVYMDAGAYGGETRDVVRSVTHMTPGGELETVPREGLSFGYRRSRYTDSRDVILWAEFSLTPRQTPGGREEINRRMEELLSRRKAKQPYDLPSAGSVFKRPQNGYAAALIEGCGLKGKAVGGAQVSPKHAGFIVNNGGASCGDVLALIKLIQETVYEQTGTKLETEVKLIGEF